jgi:predicted RNA-binding Zn-ribbon protein involved in translation (DUF1610 family)
MPDIKHPKCDHPKCGAKMQRIYKREDSRFVSIGWICVDCGLFKKDGIVIQTHTAPS